MTAYIKKWYSKKNLYDFGQSAIEKTIHRWRKSKVFQQDQLNLEFHPKQSSYCRNWYNKNKHYQFPLIVQKINGSKAGLNNVGG